MRRPVAAICCCLSISGLLGIGASEAAGQPVDDGDFYAMTLERRLTDAGVAAGALVVIRDGAVEYSGGFGVERPGGAAVDPEHTVFHAASNAKPLVAAAVMQLVGEGRLDLNADVNDYLTGFQIPAAYEGPITLDGLLTHSSGFDDHFLGGLAINKEDLTPLGPYLKVNLPSRVFPPGQRILYSNHGIALVGYIVELVSGETFADYARDHILKPLGMSNSTFVQPPPALISDRLVFGDGRTPPLLNPYPAGSLVATPSDIGRFVADQLGATLSGSSPVLTDAMREIMQQEHFTPFRGMPGSAYGYFEGNANGHRSLHHTGDGGEHSLIELVPDANLGFYLVYTTPTKADPATPREEITQDILDHLIPAMKPFHQPKPPAGFIEVAHQYVGTYRVDQYAHTTVEKVAALGQEIVISDGKDGSLGADLGGVSIRLVDTGNNLFRDPDGAYIGFHADEDGEIVGFSFNGAGVDDPGSAHRLSWWETAQTTLLFLLAVIALFAARIISGLVIRLIAKRRGLQAQQPASWRLSGWLVVITFVALATVVAGLLTSIPITRIPIIARIGLALLHVGALGAVILIPVTVTDFIRQRGNRWQRTLSVPIAAAAGAGVFFLIYWQVLGTLA